MTRDEQIAIAKSKLSQSQGKSTLAHSRKSLDSTDCKFLGDRLPGQPCGGQLYQCNKFKEVTTRFIKCDKAQRHCATCTSYEATPQPLMTPIVTSKVLKEWDETNFFPQLPGKRFNPGMIEWWDGYAFAWRDGWAGSNVWACQLNKNFEPVTQAKRLVLPHRNANFGKEDPRLFVHQGKLHVSFIGVQGTARRVSQTHQLYARLNENFEVEQVFSPKWPGVDPKRWQKNIQFLSLPDAQGKELYCFYGYSPLKVGKLNGEQAEWVSEAPGVDWVGGEIRGGATPVQVGDELWHWCHDRCGTPTRYRTMVLTTNPEPPFRILRHTPGPVLVADLKTKPASQYIPVVFTGAAVLKDGKWVVGSGIHDRSISLHEFDHEELNRAMVSARQ